jgi:hypothetical protein
MYQGDVMKKTVVAIVMASGMILGSTAVASATTTSSIKKPSVTTAEGTATHEVSESSKIQKVQTVALVKKKAVKKAVKKSIKKSAKKTVKASAKKIVKKKK